MTRLSVQHVGSSAAAAFTSVSLSLLLPFRKTRASRPYSHMLSVSTSSSECIYPPDMSLPTTSSARSLGVHTSRSASCPFIYIFMLCSSTISLSRASAEPSGWTTVACVTLFVSIYLDLLFIFILILRYLF